MTETIDVPAFEHGVVRVLVGRFGNAAALEAYAKPDGARWPLRDDLGAGELDPRGVEAFPAANLTGMGLPGYLRMAYGVAESEAAGTALAEGEDGVVLLASRAFGDRAASLTVPERLRFVGAFRDAEAGAPARPAPALGAAGAAGATSERTTAPRAASPIPSVDAGPKAAWRRAAGASGLALGALLVAAGILANEIWLWGPGLVVAGLGAAEAARARRRWRGR